MVFVEDGEVWAVLFTRMLLVARLMENGQMAKTPDVSVIN